MLLRRGAEVRALVRPRSDTRNLDQLDVELVAGDLRDRGAISADEFERKKNDLMGRL
mgnify:CR=1 FL=1